MTPQTFRVKGMHCASCASIIERTLKKVDGVESVAVNYGTETARVTFDAAKTSHQHLSQKIEPLGYSLAAPAQTAASMGMSENEHAAHLGLSQSKGEKLAEIAAMKRMVLSAVPFVWEEFFHHLLPLMATYMLFVVGKPYLLGFYRFLRHGAANMDTLIG